MLLLLTKYDCYKLQYVFIELMDLDAYQHEKKKTSNTKT